MFSLATTATRGIVLVMAEAILFEQPASSERGSVLVTTSRVVVKGESFTIAGVTRVSQDLEAVRYGDSLQVFVVSLVVGAVAALFAGIGTAGFCVLLGLLWALWEIPKSETWWFRQVVLHYGDRRVVCFSEQSKPKSRAWFGGRAGIGWDPAFGERTDKLATAIEEAVGKAMAANHTA